MAVIVGTDVYLSVADADAYWTARNEAQWNGTADAKEAALIEATQYIDGAYNFIGNYNTANVLAWPRHNAFVEKGNFAGISYDSDTIPPQIENACAELALEALSARLVPIKERGGAIKREKVDVIEVEYLDFAPSGKTFNFVTMILSPLTQGSSRMKRLERS